MIVAGGAGQVAQVAPAIAGGQQLPPQAALPFQQGDCAVHPFRRRQSGHHSGSTAADDRKFHKYGSFFVPLSLLYWKRVRRERGGRAEKPLTDWAGVH